MSRIAQRAVLALAASGALAGGLIAGTGGAAAATGPADLQVWGSVQCQTWEWGSPGDRSLFVKNNGPGDAHNVTLTELFGRTVSAKTLEVGKTLELKSPVAAGCSPWTSIAGSAATSTIDPNFLNNWTVAFAG